MRLSISGKANQRFIKDLAQRWQMTDKEALEYLLNQCRLNGFYNTFHNQYFDSSTLPEVQPPQSFYEELEQIKSDGYYPEDPVISRFVSLGLDEF